MRLLKTTYFQVLIGIALGILVGYLRPDVGVSLKVWGDAFIQAIKMIIAPVVFCTVTAGIAHMGDIKRLGRVGAKTLIYFEIVSTFALAVGLIVGLVVHPGVGFVAATTAKDVGQASKFAEQAHTQTVPGFFLSLIPESFVGAFTGGNLIQVVVIAVLAGFALLTMGEKGHRLAGALNEVSEMFFAMIGIIVKFAPLGAFGAMAYTVGNFGLGSLLNLGYLIGTFYGTSLLFVFVVLGLIARVTGFSIFKFLRYIKEELLIVLGTSSSESALPQIMAKLERLGVPKSVVGLVVPAGYSFNLDGTNIYMTLATLFLAQATHTVLTPLQLGTLLVVAMVTSKGASGVTGAGFITLAATISVVQGLPIASLALLVGVDRFMSECRALTNIVGNGVGAIVLAGWEKDLDRGKLASELG